MAMGLLYQYSIRSAISFPTDHLFQGEGWTQEIAIGLYRYINTYWWGCSASLRATSRRNELGMELAVKYCFVCACNSVAGPFYIPGESRAGADSTIDAL